MAKTKRVKKIYCVSYTFDNSDKVHYDLIRAYDVGYAWDIAQRHVGAEFLEIKPLDKDEFMVTTK